MQNDMPPTHTQPSDKVAIIMGAYNSEKFIGAQLDALINQTHNHWQLYIRNDGSNDNTLEIIQQYAKRDSRINLVSDDKGNIGYNKGYILLLTRTTEKYIAFCDADDVLFATKIEKTLKKLKEIETEQTIPALVHTEAHVVDAQLNLIKEKFIGKHGSKKGLNGIILANSVSGSSMMINEALKEIVLSTLPKFKLHLLDCHLGLMAELLGRRAFIPEPLLYYRQHANNAIGCVREPEQAGQYTLSLLSGLNMYPRIKNEYTQIPTLDYKKQLLAEYFYLFEGNNSIKKIGIYLKNRYAFTRKKDMLAFAWLLAKNQDLKSLIDDPSVADGASQSDKVAIVMATYNGEKYISEQLDSIICQTHKNWQLYIRDDGSKDNTMAIVKRYEAQDSRINLVSDDKGNLGYNKNFYQLLSLCNENYIAFCDQDDVWHSNKIATSLQKLKEIETTNHLPALVHCDVTVVDAELKHINATFIGKRGNKHGLAGLIFANSVQGAAIMINAALREIALKIQPNIPYDYHLALLSELHGSRAFIAKPLAKYRQHTQNAIGCLSRDDEARNQYTPSFLATVGLYQHIKNEYAQIHSNAKNNAFFSDYFYLFEGKNRIKKLMLYAKHRYTFSRKKDALIFTYLLLKNTDLKRLKPVQTPRKVG